MNNLDDNYDTIRKTNLKELDVFLAAALDDEEYKDIIKAQEQAAVDEKPRKRYRRQNVDRDYVPFDSFGHLERRTSARLLNKIPEYKYDDLKDEDFYSYENSDSDVENLENIVYTRKRKRMLPKKNVEPFVIVPVESITESYMANIARRDTIKKYSQNGTSCHQCRQKTLDSKTYCRSTTCVGVRGQFCGPCLINRYGEDAAVALRDPNWKCPPCRGICNCSICRTREGKRPTGILAPLAFKYGHNSVKDFLQSLNGKGDIKKDQDNGNVKTTQRNNSDDEDEGNLLGFNKDKKAVLSRKPKPDEDVSLIGFKNGQPITNVEYNVVSLIVFENLFANM